MDVRDLRIAFGNHKLPETTAIMNITSATDCPGRKLGICPCPDICYAMKAEIVWPSVLKSRRRQTKAWDACTAEEIPEEVLKRGMHLRRKSVMQTFRFSESGDFRNQADVDKMTIVCDRLRRMQMSCYGYTVRKDLDLDDLMRVAVVIGSGFMATNESRVIRKAPTRARKAVDYACPGDCRKCSFCVTESGQLIGFKQH